MKKLLSLMGCTLLCFALAGCDGYVKGDPSATCKLSRSNTKQDVLFYSDGDEIKSVEYITIGTNETEAAAKLAAKTSQAMIDNYIEEYDAQNAYVEVDGLDVKIAFEIDASKARLNSTSMKDVMAEFETQGYVCD